MLIDWFTVAAQVVNFLILVWLLKRFLYRPILRAIDERESRIARALADADAKKAEALAERDEFRRSNVVFEQQRSALMDKAAGEALTERQRLLNEARQAADALSVRRQETLRADAHRLNQDISRRARQEVFAIARRVLSDLAATGLEERMVGVFIDRLGELDTETKQGFSEALRAGPALVRSAFELPEVLRAELRQVLSETFGAGLAINFETAPEQITGIELSAGGQKLAWSVTDYLGSLEKNVVGLLKEQAAPEPEKAGSATP